MKESDCNQQDTSQSEDTGNMAWQDPSESPAYDLSTKVLLDENDLRENHCCCYFPGTPESEYYKVLRTQIQSEMRKNGWHTIMVTSAVPGEGKTITAINLALSFAKDFNQTVLLVDADLKKQQIHTYMGFDGSLGLVDCLIEDKPLSDIVVWPGVEKLTIISGDRTSADSSELVGSPKMKHLAEEMKNRYHDRLIIFDLPAIQNRADVLAFAQSVDCFLMVVESGKTQLSDVKQNLNLLPAEKFLGFVLNSHSLV